MGQFIYMLPGRGADALMVTHGITRRFPGGTKFPNIQMNHARVSLKDGLPVALGAAPEEQDVVCVGTGEVKYLGDRQEWRRVEYEGAGAWWLGWMKDAVPGPSDLVRETIVEGYPVRLRDGKDWLVPVARSYLVGTRLPQVLRLNPKGEVAGEVVPEYADLFERTCEVAAAAYGEGKLEMEQKDAFALVTDALSVNYRVYLAEVSELGLQDTAVRTQIMRALIDMPACEDWVKEQNEAALKKADGGA